MKNLLFLSHCVPNPPNKGEKIRSHQEIYCLASRYRVHLVCFARDEEEVRAAHQLSDRCASVFVENLSPRLALLRGAVRFALGGCLNTAYYWSSRMKAHVDALVRRFPIDVTLAYATVMAPYSPVQIPLLFDMQDVDSEKWLQYAQSRQPGFLFALEARRLRRVEAQWTKAAQCTLLTTANERQLLSSFVPDAEIDYMENGTDSEFYDGVARPLPTGYEGRKFVAFIGTMDYHPNMEAASWFATRIFPELRRRHPGLEFLIIGRHPAKQVSDLERLPGVTVTGGVPDTRPFVTHARALVVPLILARGIQNKVLESLAMGRLVFASAEVCRTFGSNVPRGVVCCASEREFIENVSNASTVEPTCDASIRAEACRRFSWSNSLTVILNRLDALTANKPANSMLLGETLNGT